MTWHLVFRNIARNRKNSLVIFILITVITAFFFIGNSVIGQTNEGLRKTYIDSLTADIIIQKSGDMSMNLFGANSPVIDTYASIPVLPAYDNIMELVGAEKGVEQYTSQVSAVAYMEMPSISDNDNGVLLCGIDPENYFSCFPGIELEEGRFLEKEEYGAMITAERADRLEKETGIRPVPGMPVKFTAGNDAGFIKIREVPLLGIYRYRNPGQLMNEIVIADPQTVRVLAAIQVATASVEADSGSWDEDSANILSDDIFSGTTIDEYIDPGFSPGDLEDFLTSFDSETVELAGGDWNFILIRLKQGIIPSLFIKSLNSKLLPLGVYASGWRTAAGTSAIMILFLQGFFNLGGFLVSIAGAIVVVNILLIAVFRRTREIGTLRAIGASDSYIRALILGENCFIAFLAGIAGVAAGSILLYAVNTMNIEITNALAAALLGNNILHIGFLPLTAVVSFCIALVLGAAASIFPVEMAVKINPITAVQQG